MPVPALLSLIGLVLGFAGTIILAFSLNGLLAGLALASKAHDFAIEQLSAPEGDVVIFTGTNKHIERGEKRGTWLIWIGLLLVAASFVGQAAGLLLGLP